MMPTEKFGGVTLDNSSGNDAATVLVQSEKQNKDDFVACHDEEQQAGTEDENVGSTSGVCSDQTSETTHNSKTFRCPVCRKIHSSRSSLKSHVSKHIFNVPLYQCKGCKVHFNDKKRLVKHIGQTNEGGKGCRYRYNSSYVCALCGRRFAKKTTCAEHIVHHDRLEHECKTCRWLFETSYRVRVHNCLWHLTRYEAQFCKLKQEKENTEDNVDCIKTEEPTDRKYRCWVKNCTDVLNNFEELTAHIREVHRIASLPCKICTRFFNSQDALDSHLNNHSNLNFVCRHDDCGAQYENFGQLQSHYFTRHQTKIGVSDADLYRLNGAKNSNKTNENITSERPKNSCKICNRLFKSENLLEHHLQNHDKMVHVCQQANCGWAFETPQHLGGHVSAHRSKVRQSNSQTSQSSTDGYSNVQDQLEEKKTSIEESYVWKCTGRKCSICHRYFINDKELEYHQQNHDKMVHVCQHSNCGFMYEELDQLQCHYEVRHNAGAKEKEKRPPKGTCKLCSRFFKSDSLLQDHIQRHDEMRYMCPQGCGFMYDDYNSLYKHCYAHHKITLSRANEHTYLVDNTTIPPNSGKEHLQGVEAAAKGYLVPKGTCKLCNRFFLSGSLLQDHIQRHDEMKYICPQGCGYMYDKFDGLQKHCHARYKLLLSIADEHMYLIDNTKSLTNIPPNSGKERPKSARSAANRTCRLCNRLFNTFAKLDFHVKNHDKMKYACEQGCGFMYQKFEMLRNHYYERHKTSISILEEVKYLIPETSKIPGNTSEKHEFVNQVGASNSQDTVEYESAETLKGKRGSRVERTCNICNRYFKNDEGIENHLKNHDKVKYKCQHGCGYMYQKFDRLKSHCWDKHSVEISSKNKPTYSMEGSKGISADAPTRSCSICKRKFKKGKECAAHVQRHDKMFYRCHHCKWMYEENEFRPLQKHYSRRHGTDITKADEEQCKIDRDKVVVTGVTIMLKVTSCAICERKFHMEERCAQHVQNHAKMVFKCLQCGWMYEDFESLRGHYFRRHETSISITNERQYKVDPGETVSEADAENKVEGEIVVTEADMQYKVDTSETIPIANTEWERICPECNRPLNSKEKCLRHIENHCNMVYACEYCGWLFERFHTLSLHYNRHHDTKISKSDEERYKINQNGTEAPKPQCATCRRKFMTEENCALHVACHDGMMYACEHCGYMYLEEEFNTLYFHYRQAHDTTISKADEHRYKINTEEIGPNETIEQSMKCPTSDRMFKTEDDCAQHVANHGNMVYVCEHCGWLFEDLGTLQQHYCDHHGTEISKADEKRYKIPPNETPDIQCPTCNRTFETKDKCAQHVASHNDMVYTCEHCGYLYLEGEFNTLYFHYQQVHDTSLLKIDENRYKLNRNETEASSKQCPTCNRKFKSKGICAQHIANHNDMVYTCEQCGYLYMEEEFSALYFHYRGIHDTNISKASKNQYKINRNGTDEVSRQCPTCNRKFKTEESCAQHIANHNDMVYTCEQCGYWYMEEEFSALYFHYRKVHGTNISKADDDQYKINPNKAEAPKPNETETSKQQCPTCNRKFKTEDKCAQHIAHHDDMVYTCEHCSYCYLEEEFHVLYCHYHDAHDTKISSSEEARYRITRNRTETPKESGTESFKLQCPTCNRKFVTENKCTQHVTNHDDMVYKCERCSYCYLEAEFHLLYFHSRQVHDTKISKSDEDRYKINRNGTETPKESGTESSKLQCPTCNRKFMTEENCTEHVGNHSNMVYACEHCGYLYLEEEFSALYRHYRQVHDTSISKGDEDQFRIDGNLNETRAQSLKCPTCNRVFKVEESCAQHVANHDEMVYTCEHCGFCYLEEEFTSALYQHYSRHHDTSISKSDREWYKIKHSGADVIVGTLQCPTCSRKFKAEGKFAKHVESHDDMVYVCEHCGFMYSGDEFNALYYHYSHVHATNITKSDEKRYKIRPDKTWMCKICSRVFDKEKKFKIHVENHSDLAYRCLQCGWMFKNFDLVQKHHLAEHKTSISASDKGLYKINSKKRKGRMVCPTCKGTFNEKEAYEQHVKSHGNMPYKCRHCEWECEGFELLRRHYSEKHGMKITVRDWEDYQATVKVETESKPKSPRDLVQDEHKVDEDRVQSGTRTRYKCFRCSSLFEEFHNLQEHYLDQHHTEISIDAESMCLVQIPVSPAKPQTKNDTYSAPMIDDDTPTTSTQEQAQELVEQNTVPSGSNKKKRLSEEEVVEKMKKRRRTTEEYGDASETNNDVDAPSVSMLTTPRSKQKVFVNGDSPRRLSPANKGLGSPFIKITRLDGEMIKKMSSPSKEPSKDTSSG